MKTENKKITKTHSDFKSVSRFSIVVGQVWLIKREIKIYLYASMCTEG